MICKLLQIKWNIKNNAFWLWLCKSIWFSKLIFVDHEFPLPDPERNLILPPLSLTIFYPPILKIPKYLSHPQSRVVKTLWRTSMCLMYSKENYLGHIYLKLFIPKLIMIWDSYKRPIVLPLKSWRWLSTACCDNRVFGYLQFLVVWFIQLSLSVFVTAAVARDATSPLNILFCFLEHGR